MPNDDYILRSDALSEICRDCQMTEYCRMTGESCEDVKRIKAIPAADVEPKQRWIPVTERLPEEGQVVLAFGTRSSTTGQFRGTGSKPYYWWWKGSIKRVTHWMPLPELPKGETND